MEYVSLRLDSALLKQVQKALKEFNYSTRTEFFREAVRDKLMQLDKHRKEEKAWNALFAARGIFKGKGKAKTDEEWYKWRKENGEKLMKEYAERFGFKETPRE